MQRDIVGRDLDNGVDTGHKVRDVAKVRGRSEGLRNDAGRQSDTAAQGLRARPPLCEGASLLRTGSDMGLRSHSTRRDKSRRVSTSPERT